jgi:hypothetical protein
MFVDFIKFGALLLLWCANVSGASNIIHMQELSKSDLESMQLKISRIESLAAESMQKIRKDYMVDKLPKAFLGAVAMPENSWELLVKRLYARIIEGLTLKKADDFVIAFLGSSVTAGHDNNFNTSMTEVLRELLTPVFLKSDLGFGVVVRNEALGGMNCYPYDVCSTTFSGMDVDILQWEQTYFCFENAARYIVEGMIRAALSTPAAPLIIFADSSTAHWTADACKDKDMEGWDTKHVDKAYLDKSVKEIVTVVNKDVINRWGWIKNELLMYYPQAGMQFFSHPLHEQFKCLGPYTSDFNDGAASWHPSVRAHRLRASRYAYFWLGALREALQLVKDDLKQFDIPTPEATVASKLNTKMQAAVLQFHKKRRGSELGEKIPALFYSSNYSYQCYSDFTPRHMQHMSLSALRLFKPSRGTDKWRLMVQELLLDKDVVGNARKRGYLDYKVSYIGNNSSPITFGISVRRSGLISVCQAPLIWGKPPPTCENIQTVFPKVYLTSRVRSAKNNITAAVFYEQLSSSSVLLELEKDNDTCLKTTKPVLPGHYALTVLPSNEKNIVLGFMLIP